MPPLRCRGSIGTTCRENRVHSPLSLRMVIATLLSEGTPLSIGANFGSRLVSRQGSLGRRLGGVHLEQLIETGAMPAERVLCHHEYIVDKREHDETLFNRLPPLLVLLSEVPKVVVGYDHAPCLRGKTHDETIIITNYLLVPNSPRRCEDQNPLHLQLVENILVSDGVLCTGRLSSPLRDEDSNGWVATLLEPLDGQLNAFAGEHSTISVPE